MPDAPKDVLRLANDAITRGDYEGFLARCTEDTVWTFVGERTLRGKAAVRDWMAATYTEPPRFDVQRLIADGDVVVAVGEITSPDEAGRAVRNGYCDVWRVRDGKLAELSAYVVPLAGPGEAPT